MRPTSLLFSALAKKRQFSSLMRHASKFDHLPAEHPRAIEFATLNAPVFNDSYNQFHLLARSGQTAELQRLINNCDATSLNLAINARCLNGATPLLVATQAMIMFAKLRDITDYPYIIRTLLHLGADPNIAETTNYSTPLHNAAQFSINVVETLVDNHAIINLPDREGNTALHLALFANNEQSISAASYLVKKMLQAGINPNAENARKQTPLCIAKETKNLELIEQLRSARVPLQQRRRHTLS